jgi:hypothetical protein
VDERNAAQAVQLIRALRDQRHKGNHVSSRQDRWANTAQWVFQYSIVCTLKRPLPNW